jgi:antitoxin component of MazEF toxin-antitoxin module
MKAEYVKVQKHCINESYFVTIPSKIAKAIPITQGDLMKAVLDGTRVIMEKV